LSIFNDKKRSITPQEAIMTDASHRAPAAQPGDAAVDGPAPLLEAIVIGAGFGGIGMAVALRKAGVVSFLVLERAADIGGVWRDNSYPGAACDVPSHLYSFSFEPNPGWTRRFANQPEIHEYLHHCVRKYALGAHIRCNSEVTQAEYDEEGALWRVSLADGTRLQSRMLVTATGQLSRPVVPPLEGVETFRGKCFHSSQWDHAADLTGKRVAVIGTGASATQFVPPLAREVARLLVFQRSPAYLVARRDYAYPQWAKALFLRAPFAMRLHRAWLYLAYESRALAFTRFHLLLKLAVGRPFKRMLARQVGDPALRARLAPAYPIGCKRLLLSNDYLQTLSRPNVTLVTESIRRVTDRGIETADGRQHRVDAIVYGTGFAATEFLAPMRITGRGGVELNQAWRGGAMAYLGMTVPGFPNLFMLYGPNTNLGHNSIVYMLEGQVAHVMRCRAAMQAAGARAIEVDAARHRRFNIGIQRRLAGSVWSGCQSWYLDEHGRNSTNWPGFSLSYRWRTRFSSLRAYALARPLPGHAGAVVVAPPNDWWERLNAAFLRGFLRTCFRPLVGPPFGARMQRLVVGLLAPLMPGVAGVARRREIAGGVPVEVLTAADAEAIAAILYLHGGAFCLGGPSTHRSITSRLAAGARLQVWVPDYRLAPEHPYPAALDDAQACYRHLLALGIEPRRIVLAGDSAGGALVLALALRLRDAGCEMPAGLMLMSPLVEPALSAPGVAANARIDPMVRKAWVEQGIAWYGCPPGVTAHRPLAADLSGLPPMLVQVGDREILLSDSLLLATHARKCGLDCRLEVHEGRWHVFHLQSFYLASARAALRTLAGFAQARVRARHGHGHQPGDATVVARDAALAD
jgi:cation diffusion facilitator CzcD-associated flavoprotein CzcO/acetyl esterase/lipase